MKKLLFYLLIFTLFAAAAGCSSGKDDDGNPDVRFYAVPASLNFEAGKTTLQLSISTTGHWTIVCDDEWLEAVPAEGTGSAKVGITAQANPLAQQRTSSLTIAYGGAEPAVVPVTQKVSGEESVDLFGSTDEMKAYLKARVEACNYAESVTTTAGGVLKFGFKGAATRGVRKEAIPFFTVNGGGYWAADGVATPVKADAEALRGGASPAVTLTAGGTIAFDGTERGAISGLCDYIQQAQPLDRPTIGYIMAQAYGAYHSHYPKYFANQQAMFEAIVAQVRKITAQTCIDIVIPSGTSLQNLRTSSLNRDNGMDLTRDSYHMDYGISRYAAAATVFRTLVTPCTGVSVEGNGYRYSTSSTSTTGYSTPVTDANAPVAIRAALEACRTPYAVTDMSKY